MKFNLILHIRDGKELKERLVVEANSEIVPRQGERITYSLGNNKVLVGTISEVFHNFGFEQVAVPTNIFAEVIEQDFLSDDVSNPS